MKTAQALIRLVTVLMLALGLGLGTASPASADTGPGDAALQIELPQLPGSGNDDFLDALLELLRQLLRQIAADLDIEIPLPGGDNGNGGDPPIMTTCPDWANLARAESPTVAFASEQECIDYIDDRGTTVPVEVPTTCPNFASVATSENPTVAFTSEAECVTYIDGGGATVPVEVVVTCPNFASLARTETPTVAFTSEAECIAYIIGGGTTVPVETVVFNPVVALEATGGTTDGKCDVEVSITGFLPNTTYGGNVQTAGGGFGGNVKLGMSIVTDANGAGSMQPGSIAPGMYRAAITVGPGAAEFSNDVSISCDIPDDDGIGVSFSLVVT